MPRLYKKKTSTKTLHRRKSIKKTNTKQDVFLPNVAQWGSIDVISNFSVEDLNQNFEDGNVEAKYRAASIEYGLLDQIMVIDEENLWLILEILGVAVLVMMIPIAMLLFLLLFIGFFHLLKMCFFSKKKN